MRCVACNAEVEYGQDLCHECQSVVDELLYDTNMDILDKVERSEVDPDTLSDEDIL